MSTLLLAFIYIGFVSLGLPDALLGASWPVMQSELGVPYGYAGLASIVISSGTILSSIFSNRVLKRIGTGLVTALSVALTALALLGFSLAPSFWWIILAAVPLGLGAGAIDAGLNAYVAAHYESRHMSWLHSCWGVGALSGPFLLSGLLAHDSSWRGAYLVIAIFQVVLAVLLVAALPLWGKVRPRIESLGDERHADVPHQALFSPLKIKGVKLALTSFFFYCAIESTIGLWGGSFLFKSKGLASSEAATWVAFFYVSITAGRFLTGFVTYHLSNRNLIRGGALAILAGVLLMLLPLPQPFALAGLLVVGLGCAPIFPCMLHETPARFGAANAPAIMGFQMAGAYIGTTLLPPLFGLIASATSLALLPVFLAGYALVLIASTEALRERSGSTAARGRPAFET